MNPRITLKPGKEKPLLAHHPWIFSGAIARVENASDGDTVEVCDSAGRFVARGFYNSKSQIAVRVWTFEDEPIDRAFLRTRLARAASARASLIDPASTNAYRLVNAESDFLPGLVLDRYADFVLVQFLTLGVEKRKAELVELVAELQSPRGVYERSDVDVREKEGLASSAGVLCGEEPPERIEIRENDYQFLVDVKRGHKTGFYLDQRENRRRISELSSAEVQRSNGAREQPLMVGGQRSVSEVLNVFAYTGGFAVYVCASNRDARVVNLDASRDALNLARENMRRNDCETRGEFVEGDAFQILRRYRYSGKSFDAIILDPPKFVLAQSQLQ